MACRVAEHHQTDKGGKGIQAAKHIAPNFGDCRGCSAREPTSKEAWQDSVLEMGSQERTVA